MIPEQRFRADIQGLRALAVLPVAAFHASPRLAPGGFFGVDIFFVISGYLITHILLREMERDSFSLADFYARRVKRLFPALYLMLSATMVAGILLLPPSSLKELASTAQATIVFASNIRLMRLSSYFGGAADLKPLLHTWSLAVEEQFYLVFPLFLFVVARYARAWLSPILWTCAVLSFALATWMLRRDPTQAFYLPQARAYELLIGALLAAGAVPHVKNAKALDTLSLLGLGLILFGLFGLDGQSAYRWPAAIIACLGSALVIHAGQGRNSLGGRLISGRAMVLIGALSYSLYLWHWPVLVFARYLTLGRMPATVIVAALVIAFILAWLSWRFVEEPARTRHFTRTHVLAAGGGAIVVASALTMGIWARDGLPGRFNPETRRLFAGERDSSPYRGKCHSSGVQRRMIAYEHNCLFGDPKAAPRIAIWGDSFGAELAVALGEQFAPRHAAIMQITTSTCPPSSGDGVSACARHNRETLARIVADPRIERVILAASYLRYGWADHQRPVEDFAADQERFLAGFAKAAEALSAAGKHITLVYPIPAPPFDVPQALGMLSARGRDYRGYGTRYANYIASSGWAMTRLDALAARVQADRIVPARRLCANGVCHTYADGVGPLYFDDNHLSMAGARYVLTDMR